jgi:hypothetical protein
VLGPSNDFDEAALRAGESNKIFSGPPSNAPASLYPHPIGSHPICRWNGISETVEHESVGNLLSGRTPRRSGEKRALRRKRSLGARDRWAIVLVGGVPI